MLDSLIKNGHVINPANRIDQIGNIATYNGGIARYKEKEPARHATDAVGRYVLSGLIDTHAHMSQEGTETDTHPDMTYLSIGVTSVIDFLTDVASYPISRSAVIARSGVTIKSPLQMYFAGLTVANYHERVNPKFFNPEKIVRICHDSQDNILGLKIYQGEELVERLGIEPLKETARMAGTAGYSVEVHRTNILVSISKVLRVLRPGDIFEHVYQGVKNTIIDENGKLYDYVREVREQRVISDTAERGRHGDFDATFKAKERGFIADMCSADLILGSMFRRPIFSLPNLMFRYICMGIPMSQVVSVATEHSAGLMKMQGEIGCLLEGARAGVAIFRWMDSKQAYKDWRGTAFTADKLLKPEMTIKDGQITYCAPDYTYKDWI